MRASTSFTSKPKTRDWKPEMKRIIAIAFLAFFFGGVALAQEPKKTNDGYEPVNGDMMQPGESLPASRLVAGAYGFIFAAVLISEVELKKPSPLSGASAD